MKETKKNSTYELAPGVEILVQEGNSIKQDHTSTPQIINLFLIVSNGSYLEGIPEGMNQKMIMSMFKHFFKN